MDINVNAAFVVNETYSGMSDEDIAYLLLSSLDVLRNFIKNKVPL